MTVIDNLSLNSIISNSRDEPTDGKVAKAWSIEDSENLYRIQGWGDPYFSINGLGHVMVSPQGDRGGSLDLYELVEGLRQRNIDLPVLIRFSDILGDRMERIQGCFKRAIARYNYENVYRGVYPVKCNQHRHIVEGIVRYGKPYQFGLEAGSKPELIIALAALESSFGEENDQFEPLLICNGYKDKDYIETALLSIPLGYRPIIVIEQLEELYITLSMSAQLGIDPIVGVRAKLSTQGVGRWGSSTGDRAKFGLTIPEILTVVRELKDCQKLHTLKLLHFHIGSQIPSISVIKDAIREASRIYVNLWQLGANMQYLDVGGGLGVDYDGSQTNFYASKNYKTQHYANDIVAEVKETCVEANIPVPTLVSESGRAIAAHHSVLVFDVLGTNEVSPAIPTPLVEKEHTIIRNLWDTYTAIQDNNYQEMYHDAIQFKEEAISLFNFGYLTLAERARAEELYWACCRKIWQVTRNHAYVPDDLEDLEQSLASIYYMNLSVFQSVADSWAIDQLFPIMPIHRLTEEPTKRGILADLTCDSDGKINQFIDLEDVKSLLELHPLKKIHNPENSSVTTTEPYYLGMFLVGAYQEIMGNLHNLFGDTNVVHITMNPKGYELEYVVKGDTITEVLGYVQYDWEDLLEKMRRKTEKALKNQQITLEQSQRLLQNYEMSMRSYTYLSKK